VFEEFSQVDSPVQRTAKGTGLGLPLSRKLATILGGTATVESTPGIGSVFHLTIPMQFQEVRGETTPALDGEPVSLIIDDDEVSRYLLKGLLHWANVRIVEASNGTEGLRAAHALKPSVIFLDLNIPDLNGFEILDRLKSDQNTADIPVVIYTSRILDEKERAALSRAAGILMKGATSREEQLEALEAAFERAGLDFANRNVKA
jgi:CheY-like chemotaxis protein